MNQHNNNYDLIVIGGGPMGLSTAYHASKKGLRTLVIERFGFLNNAGSSAGMSRQFRLQYAQKYMSKLALSAQSYWAELQLHTQETLIGQVGSLWFGDPALSSQEGGIAAAETTMDELGIPYTKLTSQEIEDQYHFKNIPADYSGFFQADGGIINLKATQEAMYNVALESGLVDFHAYEQVTNIVPAEDGVAVMASNATGNHLYQCAKLAITPGPFVNEVLAPLQLTIQMYIWEMSSAYYRKEHPEVNFPTWFVFQEPQETSLFYGFPEVDWSHPGYIRVAPDIPDRIISDPAQRSGSPSPKSLALNNQWVANHMEGLDANPQFTSTCLIALSENSKEILLDYVADNIKGYQNIVVYTVGWAAKFIPLIGEMMLQMFDREDPFFVFDDYRVARKHFKIKW
ncbi:MAG: FAD-dependent oxidoreductase [Bacteroidota bacterium]